MYVALITAGLTSKVASWFETKSIRSLSVGQAQVDTIIKQGHQRSWTICPYLLTWELYSLLNFRNLKVKVLHGITFTQTGFWSSISWRWLNRYITCSVCNKVKRAMQVHALYIAWHIVFHRKSGNVSSMKIYATVNDRTKHSFSDL